MPVLPYGMTCFLVAPNYGTEPPPLSRASSLSPFPRNPLHYAAPPLIHLPTAPSSPYHCTPPPLLPAAPPPPPAAPPLPPAALPPLLPPPLANLLSPPLPLPHLRRAPKKKKNNKGKDKASPKVERGLLEEGLNGVTLLGTPAQQVPTFYTAATATYSGRSAHYTLLALASAHTNTSLARARLELEYYSLRVQALCEGLQPPPPQTLVTLAPEYLSLFTHAQEGLYDSAPAARRPPLFDQVVLGQNTVPLDTPHTCHDPLPHPASGTSALFRSPALHRRDNGRNPAPHLYYDPRHADTFAPGHLFRNTICSDIEMDTASQGPAGAESQGAEGHYAIAAGDDLPLSCDDNDLPQPHDAACISTSPSQMLLPECCAPVLTFFEQLQKQLPLTLDGSSPNASDSSGGDQDGEGGSNSQRAPDQP
ncbi:hypothetical protein DFH09DRAFT_1306502 [Mycena vulgaris]|nr:hypothetical protein DFH09DRAFT_1306502 [Mycena vulgaris]